MNNYCYWKSVGLKRFFRFNRHPFKTHRFDFWFHKGDTCCGILSSKRHRFYCQQCIDEPSPNLRWWTQRPQNDLVSFLFFFFRCSALILIDSVAFIIIGSGLGFQLLSDFPDFYLLGFYFDLLFSDWSKAL